MENRGNQQVCANLAPLDRAAASNVEIRNDEVGVTKSRTPYKPQYPIIDPPQSMTLQERLASLENNSSCSQCLLRTCLLALWSAGKKIGSNAGSKESVLCL